PGAAAMTATTRPVRDPTRSIEAALLGALFLGAMAALSLPLPAWLSSWLLLGPGTALAMAGALRLSRRASPAAPAAAVAPRRRRAAQAVAMRRHGSAPRRGRHLLAALALL